MAKNNHNSRQELDINLPIVISVTIGLTLLVYGILFPFQKSYLGILLYERGFTQHLVILFSSFIIGTTINKFIKIKLELNDLKENWIPETISFDNPKSVQLINMWRELEQDPSLIALRCSRIIGAYINSGSRKAATELAIDDSSFYLSASEASYAFPRILIWAIPLLGFIGTVLGISVAVNGFSTFLENTVEIDQIKQGIGIVTKGLAVAFDTTLLALFFSIVVMIPLVLVERLESKLLLQIDVYINDKLLPKLKEKEYQSQPFLDTTMVINAVENTIKGSLPSRDEFIQPIKDALPSAEDLIKPAEKYAQKAANRIAESFISQFIEIQTRETELIQAIKQVNLIALDDREDFMKSFSDQQKLNYAIIREIQDIVAQIKRNNDNIVDGLSIQATEISKQLSNAANSLESKVISLEKSAEKIAQLNQMQDSLIQLVKVLENSDKMQEILSGIKDNILTIQPALLELGKPRIIKLVEQIEQNKDVEKDA